VSEWKYAQQERSEKLAKLHFFSVVKSCPQGDIELRITVKEFATPDTGNLQFFAETDKPLNANTAPFHACGWGDSLMGALAECMRNVRKFDYHHEEKATHV